MVSDPVVEDVLESDIPIIDPHHHLWSKAPNDYYGTYSAEELVEDIAASGHAVCGTVYTDSHSNYRDHGPEHLRTVGETEFADAVARQAEDGPGPLLCAAIVSSANMMKGAAVGELLDAHMAASPRFRGIRHMTAFDHELPPVYGAVEAELMMQPAFAEGCMELQRRGLTFDAWLFQPQLPELIALARLLPELRIVLDHTGGPLAIGRFAHQREEAFSSWKRGMATLAELPNIFVKLGGLNMAQTGMVPDLALAQPYTSSEMADAQRSHILTAIDLFGPQRCMFESNFPVDREFASYRLIWNCFKRLTQDFAAHERAALFAGTACSVYSIQNEALEGRCPSAR